MKRCYLLFFILYSTCGICQLDTIKIIDSETKNPIPFASIRLLNQEKKITTNFDGKFIVDSSFQLMDTIEISCIGYKKKSLSGSEFMKLDMIELSANVQKLQEIQVVSKNTKFKSTQLGVTSEPKTFFFHHYLIGKAGDIKAVWIPNKKSLKGYINAINIYITDFGYPNAYFRLHIYDCSPMEIKPNIELTDENIVTKGTSGNEWIHIDVKHLNLHLPENGFFVGIEWFSKNSNIEFSDTIVYEGAQYDKTYKRFLEGSGCVLGTKDEKYRDAKYKFWQKTGDNKWDLNSSVDESRFNIPDTLDSGKIHVINENNLYIGIPCINAEVKYVKDKNETIYKGPKKRKLNRIEKVKEDLFLYPQNSIDDLFSSLIKAFKNDHIIYILKYLCVYKEDEFDSILEDIEMQDIINNGINKKEEIIAELTKIKNTMKNNDLIEIGNFLYQLNVGQYQYHLKLENGKWKINPYTEYKILQKQSLMNYQLD